MFFHSIPNRQRWEGGVDDAVVRRRFAHALLISIALHIIVLSSGLHPPTPQKLAQPLMATLRGAMPTAVEPPSRPEPAQERPKPVAPPPEILHKPPAKERQPARVERPVPAPAEGKPSDSERDAKRTTDAPVTSPSADVPAPAVATPPSAANPASTGLDPKDLAQYKIWLTRAMPNSQENYPPLARERGWEGETDLHVKIFADGRTPQVVVAKPSKYNMLDKRAIEMLLKGWQQAQLPDNLRGKDFEFDITVIFTLVKS